MIYAIALMFALSAFLFAVSLIPSKSEVTVRLEQMERMAFDPQTGSRAAALERLFSARQKSELQRLLSEAGWYTVAPSKMGMRIFATFLFACALGVGLCTFLELSEEYLVFGTAGIGFVGAYLPLFQLKAAVRKRKVSISRALPDLLDMLSTSMQAGLAFNAALNYATDAAQGSLGEELRAVLSEMRLGRGRAEALRSLSERLRIPEISMMVTAIVQAERLGSNLANVLEELARETRAKRMVRAEEIAALMPIKMVFPMALFMLPALFVIIFGGVMAEYFSK